MVLNVSRIADENPSAARDLIAMDLVDEVIDEPSGGAHANHEQLFKNVDKVLWRQLQELSKIPREKLPQERYKKFRDMGRAGREFLEVAEAGPERGAAKRARSGDAAS